MSPDYIIRLQAHFSYSARVECVILLNMPHSSIYLHIPFCRRRCGYCDFNTFAGLSRFIPGYVDALCQEVKWAGENADSVDSVHTIFFGGGTPSLLNSEQVSRILSTIRGSFQVLSDAEITMEANPGTVTRESIAEYAGAGVNRLSFGMQSAHPEDLRTLDRTHTFSEVLDAVKFCRLAGIRHINLDLIFGIPGQTLDRWRNTLELAVATGVDHLSLYALTIEEGTPMHHWASRGLIDIPDDDLAAEMYELAEDLLGGHGFEQYEISNWARGEDARCRHNVQYWEYGPYFGFGAGAHGFVNGVRTENVHSVFEYLKMMKEGRENEFPGGPAVLEVNRLTAWEQMQEMLMVGLRMTSDGVSARRFEKRFGLDMEHLFEAQFIRLEREGLIEWIDKPERSVRLTQRGKLLGNQVFMEFIGNNPPDEFSQVIRPEF